MRFLLPLLLCFSALGSECAHRLKCESGKETYWGTAVVLNDGNIVTAAHVVEHKGKLEIEVEGKWIPCEVVRCEKACDLAKIQTGTKIQGGVELAETITFTVEASPKSRKVEAQQGAVTGGSLACKMEPGMSGGAITKGGKLYGILVSADPDNENKDTGMANVGRFVSADVIREFLKK